MTVINSIAKKLFLSVLIIGLTFAISTFAGCSSSDTAKTTDNMKDAVNEVKTDAEETSDDVKEAVKEAKCGDDGKCGEGKCGEGKCG